MRSAQWARTARTVRFDARLRLMEDWPGWYVRVASLRWQFTADSVRETPELQGIFPPLERFAWETTTRPKTREGELLAACVRKQGKLPRYNRPDSLLHPTRTCVTGLRARG
jgi:hypothetical protein